MPADSIHTIAEGEKELVIYGPASVEMRDGEGEIIKADALENALPQLLRRARFSKQHEDILPGEILPMYKDSNNKIWKTEVKYPSDTDIEMFPHLKKDVPALFLVGNVFGDSETSRQVRKDIIENKLNSFSVSGAKLAGKPGIISEMDLDAVTICEQGMNPYAKFKYIAKSYKNPGVPDGTGPRGGTDECQVKKPFAGYKDFKACVASNQDKNNPEAYCAEIMREVEKIDKEFTIKEESEVNKMPEETKKQEEEETPAAPEAPPAEEEVTEEIIDTAEQIGQLAEQVAAIAEEVDKMKKTFFGKKEDTEEKPEDEEEDVEKAESEEQTVSKIEEMRKDLKEIKKSLKVRKATTPRPPLDANAPLGTPKEPSMERLAKTLGESKPTPHRLKDVLAATRADLKDISKV